MWTLLMSVSKCPTYSHQARSVSRPLLWTSLHAGRRYRPSLPPLRLLGVPVRVSGFSSTFDTGSLPGPGTCRVLEATLGLVYSVPSLL